MAAHVLKQWMKKHHGDIEILTVPGQFWKALVKRIGFKQVLMMDQVVIGSDVFGRTQSGLSSLSATVQHAGTG